MRSNEASPDLDGGSGPRWPSRLGWALGITALQALAAAAVFALFMIPAANAVSEGPDDWAGFEYIVIGVFAAPVIAAITGVVVASRMRLPLYGLYSLPVLLAAAMLIAPVVTNGGGSDLPGLPIYIGGNLLIALATVRLPRRPRKPRMSDRGVPL